MAQMGEGANRPQIGAGHLRVGVDRAALRKAGEPARLLHGQVLDSGGVVARRGVVGRFIPPLTAALVDRAEFSRAHRRGVLAGPGVILRRSHMTSIDTRPRIFARCPPRTPDFRAIPTCAPARFSPAARRCPGGKRCDQAKRGGPWAENGRVISR